MIEIVNRISLTLVTLGSLITVLLLARWGVIQDGDTVGALGTIVMAYVGGHAVQRGLNNRNPPPGSGGNGNG